MCSSISSEDKLIQSACEESYKCISSRGPWKSSGRLVKTTAKIKARFSFQIKGNPNQGMKLEGNSLRTYKNIGPYINRKIEISLVNVETIEIQ